MLPFLPGYSIWKKKQQDRGIGGVGHQGAENRPQLWSSYGELLSKRPSGTKRCSRFLELREQKDMNLHHREKRRNIGSSMYLLNAKIKKGHFLYENEQNYTQNYTLSKIKFFILDTTI